MQVQILEEFDTNTPHVLGTTEPPGTVGPVGAGSPASWRVSGLEHPFSLEHNLDERDSLKKCRFDQMVEARITWINGSTYTVTQPPQPSSRGNPRHLRAWSVHHTMQVRADRA
jgi:hypothetical protein